MDIKTPFGSGTPVVLDHDTGQLGGDLLSTAFFGSAFNLSLRASHTQAALEINQVIVSNPPYQYLDCRAATTANITLSGIQTVDGVALMIGDRVLVKNQTTIYQNGVYYVATGAWTKSPDVDYTYPSMDGKILKISEGTTYAGQWAILNTAGAYSPITFNFVPEHCQTLLAQTGYYLKIKNFGTGTRSTLTVTVATTGAVTLSGLQTIDGVSLVDGNTVLLKDQTAPTPPPNQPIYTVHAGAWTRQDTNVTSSHMVYVYQGAVNGRRFFAANGAPPTFTQIEVYLYATMEDAIAETNKIIPVYKSFEVFWIVKKYAPVLAYLSAEPDTADIYCCPPATEYETNNLIDTAVVTCFGVTFTLKAAFNGTGSTFMHGFLAGYAIAALWMTAGITVGTIDYTISIALGYPTAYMGGPAMDYDHIVGEMVCTRQDTTLGVFGATSIFAQMAPVAMGDLSTPQTFIDLTSTAFPVTFSGNWKYPDTIRLVLKEAYFPTGSVFAPPYPLVTLPSEIELGDLDVVLTYDAATNSYLSDIMNLYNVPGRLVFERINLAYGGYSGGYSYDLRVSMDQDLVEGYYYGTAPGFVFDTALDYPLMSSGSRFLGPIGANIGSPSFPTFWSIIGPGITMAPSYVEPLGTYHHGLAPGTLYIDSRATPLDSIGHFSITRTLAANHMMIRYASSRSCRKPSPIEYNYYTNPAHLVMLNNDHNVYTVPEFFVCSSHVDSYYTSLE